jgi:hypothetical protein
MLTLDHRGRCVLTYCTTFVRNISHSKTNERDIIKILIDIHVKYSLFLLICNKNLIFLTDFLKLNKSNMMKIRPVGTQLFHPD